MRFIKHNIAAALEIFRSVWLIEDHAGLALFQVWEERNANPKAFEDDEDKEPVTIVAPIVAASNGQIMFAPVDLYSKAAAGFTGFEGAAIAVIPIEGALMKSDYCGMAGTATMLSYFRMAEQAKSVKEIMLLIDSPGGTVNGTESFANAIAASQKTVTAVVSGMCCSAAYWLASGADKIISTSKTDIIGSIGTKISFYDNSAALEQRGIVLREYTATRSADKGKDFNEAAKGNGKLIIKSMLDPMNDVFVQAIEANRHSKIDAKAEDVLTGKTYVSAHAMLHGLIDAIQPLEDVFSQALKQHTPKQNFSMKDFKLVLLATAIASVYEENKFFGLTEDQLEKVEARLQELEAANVALAAELANLGDAATTTAASITALNTQIENLKAENQKLSEQTAGKTVVVKEKDPEETQASLPKTSVDIWFENLNK